MLSRGLLVVAYQKVIKVFSKKISQLGVIGNWLVEKEYSFNFGQIVLVQQKPLNEFTGESFF